MSTLVSVNHKHPSSSVNNLVLDASGNVAVGAALTVAGVSAVAVAPSTSGNVLTSNGTAWTSAAPSGGVSSIVAGTGISVSGTTSITVNVVNTTGAVGTYAFLGQSAATTAGTSYAGSLLQYAGIYLQGNNYYGCAGYLYNSYNYFSGGTPSGTWKAMGASSSSAYSGATLFVRIA